MASKISLKDSPDVIYGVLNDDELDHRQISVIVIGAGDRGNVYSTYSKDFPHLMRVVGVAEPRETRRKMFAEKYNIMKENVFQDWKEVTVREKFADAVIITTLDNLHRDPCVAFADMGYHILCEKPMACTQQDCEDMVEAAYKNNVILAFGHVMRYTNENVTVKKLLNDGVIGDIVGIQHLEPVGWWHFAHSFVRGNWSKQVQECGSLMAKSCHDLDLIKYFIGNPRCLKIQSFGTLKHFRKENKPADAGNRCVNCRVEPTCPYSAVRQYVKPIEEGRPNGFCYVVCDVPDIESINKALHTGPYGKCVYDTDNDVCDHQIVNMEFEGGIFVNFTMSAFTQAVCERKITIFGTMGQIEMQGSSFSVFDFRTEKKSIYKPTPSNIKTSMKGHGCGDFYLCRAFVQAVAKNDPSYINSGPRDSLRGHLLVFAAEKSRNNGYIMLDVNI